MLTAEHVCAPTDFWQNNQISRNNTTGKKQRKPHLATRSARWSQSADHGILQPSTSRAAVDFFCHRHRPAALNPADQHRDAMPTMVAQRLNKWCIFKRILDRPWRQAINAYASAFFDHIWFGSDLELWPFDLKTSKSNPFIRVTQNCQFGEIPPKLFRRYVHKLSGCKHGRTQHTHRNAHTDKE